MRTIKRLTFSLTLLFLSTLIATTASGCRPVGKRQIIVSDTTKKLEKKGSSYSKRSVTIYDENGNPHTETTESFDGDEDWAELLNEDWIADLDLPSFPALPENFDGIFDGSTLESMGNDFNKAFGPELQAGMEAMRDQIEKMEFEFDRFEDINERLTEELGRFDMPFNFDGLERLGENFSDQNGFNESWEGDIQSFEEAITDELIKDGYLKETDTIESMSWSDDAVKFNGKTIKDEHKAKYQRLRERYLNKRPYRGRIE